MSTINSIVSNPSTSISDSAFEKDIQGLFNASNLSSDVRGEFIDLIIQANNYNKESINLTVNFEGSTYKFIKQDGLYSLGILKYYPDGNYHINGVFKTENKDLIFEGTYFSRNDNLLGRFPNATDPLFSDANDSLVSLTETNLKDICKANKFPMLTKNNFVKALYNNPLDPKDLHSVVQKSIEQNQFIPDFNRQNAKDLLDAPLTNSIPEVVKKPTTSPIISGQQYRSLRAMLGNTRNLTSKAFRAVRSIYSAIR